MEIEEDPKFISYLLDPKLGHDCYFIVGNESLVTPVKIGAVKKMLLAHSLVLRNELEDSDMAEKDVVKLNDINPDTFNNFLRCIYGYDITVKLAFEDADDLLYVADKYLIDDLKDRLAKRLMSLLTYDNICGLMNNPACYRHLELNNAITRILQYDTGKVLKSDLFLKLSPNAFIKILEQGSLSEKEVEIWNSAIKWSKHQKYLQISPNAFLKMLEQESVSASEMEIWRTGMRTKQEILVDEDETANNRSLRSTLSPLLQYLRLCTLTAQEFCEHLVPAGVLELQELYHVSKSIGLKKQDDQLLTIYNTVTPRTNPVINFNITVAPSQNSSARCSLAILATKGFCIAMSSNNISNAVFYEANSFPEIKKVAIHNGNFYLNAHSCYIIVTQYDQLYNTYSLPRGKFENDHLSIFFDVSHIKSLQYSIGTSDLRLI